MRTGIDVISTQRFDKNKKSFIEKTFTSSEQEYVKTRKNKAESYAGLYACKEAFLKAIGVGVLNGTKLTEIEILHYENGAPYLKLNKQILKTYKIKKVAVSISHDEGIATAICVIN